MQKLNGLGSHNREITVKIKIEIALFFILAFAVRFFLLDINKLPFPDSMNYIMLGYNFIRGNFSEGVSFFYPMLYPMFVGLFSLIITDYILAGYITSIFFGSLLVIPTYLLAYNIGNRQIARFSTFLLVFYPLLIEWSNEPIADIAYTFFFMSSIYIGWQAIKTDKLNNYLATGVLIGLTYLTRSVGFFVFLLIFFTVLFFNIKKNKRWLRNLIAFILGFSIFAASYIIFERIYTKQWTISIVSKYNLTYHNLRNYGVGKTVLEKWESGLRNNNSTTLIDDFVFMTGKASNKPILPIVDKVPLKKRVMVPLKYIYQFYNDSLYKIFPPIILILFSMGFGSGLAFASKVPKDYYYLLVFMILPVSLYFYSHIEERYFLSMIPIAIIFSGAGVDCLFKAIRNKAGHFIIIFIVFSLLILDMPSLREKIKLLKGTEKPVSAQMAAGLWLRKNYPDYQLRLMDVDTRTALYARTNKLVILPAYCTIEEMVKYAKLKKVDFIIIGERGIIIQDRYRQKPLLAAQNVPEDLELVYQYDADKNWGKMLIYKLKK